MMRRHHARSISRIASKTGLCLGLMLLIAPPFQFLPLLQPIASAHAQAQAPCPNLPSGPPGPDFSKKDLSGMSFSGRDLRRANFSGSTLKGTVFIGADLSGANFSGATVQQSEREDLRPTDFTGANLSNACLAGMVFRGRTYFTYADISCADFSRNDLSGGLAIFGQSPLKIDPASSCKPAFRGSVMHCEFVADWPRLDLGAGNGSRGADLHACATQLAGMRLDGAMLDGVNLAGAVLDGASLAGASLKKANLDNASLQCRADQGQCVDLHNANLQGATLIGANLSGANLQQAVLSGETGGPAANLSSAHLRNVNLSYAQLTGADFTGANFYGTYYGKCVPTDKGFTKGCATAYGATMTDTRFTNAYLYGVNFGATAINGATFDGAVLVAADFSAAAIGTGSNGGRTSFNGAWLQGTNLNLAASLRDADLSNAYLDFRPRGNQLYLLLPGPTYNRHACDAGGCKPSSPADVCVSLSYPESTVPGSNNSIICPDGFPAGAGVGTGCGRAQANGANPHWKNNPPANTLQAWYGNDATYAPAASPGSICNGRGAGTALTSW
jgi:uncharacterized protein YjbI with pentapeptide repeats